jgi:hypothetical protein
MKKLATYIQAHPNAKSAKPVDAAEIKNQESKLGLCFGSQYMDFLKEFGCLVVGPNEIYGICGKNNAIPSAIHATLSARKNKSFPGDLLVIAEDGRGKFICIDSNDAVFSIEHGTMSSLNQSFEDFAIGWLGS